MKIGGLGETARIKFNLNWAIQPLGGSGSVTSMLTMNPASASYPALNYIAQCYNNFRFENVCFEFVPSLSFTSNGVFHGTFLNNPEVMGKAVLGGISNLSEVVLNTIATRSSHLTDSCIIRNNLPNRRPWYSTDSCVSGTASDTVWNTYDRSIQSLFVCRIEGGPAGVLPGIVRMTGTCVFEGLSPINLAIGCDGALLKVAQEPIRRTLPDGRILIFDPQRGTSTIYDPLPADTPTALQSMEVDAPDTA